MLPEVYGHPSMPHLEQQEDLLESSGSGIKLLERVEAAGAIIENTLQQFQLDYTILFFLAGVSCVVVGALSALNALWAISLVGLVQAVFLLGLGGLLTLLDFPGSPLWASPVRYSVRKQLKFLTKTSGRGLLYFYLACLALTLQFGYRVSGGVSIGVVGYLTRTLVVLLALVPLAVGVLTVFIGVRKSLQLERIKRSVNNEYKGNLVEIYKKYAITDCDHGLQFAEFGRLANDYSYGQADFSLDDLYLIFNSLDDQQKGAINRQEFHDWLSSTFTFL